MADPSDPDNTPNQSQSPPRALADFGGRRKIFERRLRRARIDHPDRRSDADRRSGFDRRSMSEGKEVTSDKRQDDAAD